MQRDSYAILIKKKGKEIIPAAIEQLSGEVFHEKLFDEVFDGYRDRRLVLMTHMAKSTTPAVTASLIKNGASNNQFVTPGPLLSHDVIIDDWKDFKKVHRPNYLYRLLPLICGSRSSFAALQSICVSPGSPFTIADRKDQVPFRIQFWANGPFRTNILRFFEKNASVNSALPPPPTCPQLLPKQLQNGTIQLPISQIDFDGLLLSKCKNHLGFMHMSKAITAERIHQMYAMVRLFCSEDYCKIAPSGPGMVEILRAKERYLFLAGEAMIPKAQRKVLIPLAKERNIHLYHQTEKDVFTFVQ